MIVRAAFVLMALLAGCRSVYRASSVCAPVSQEPGVAHASEILASQLIGDFRLSSINTAGGTAQVLGSQRLHLVRPDSATIARSRVRGLGHYPRAALQLVGHASIKGFAQQDKAEFDAGILYIGCRDCMDASPTIHRILEVSAGGFRGTWQDNMTGIAVMVDQMGRRLPNPQGYFCAERE